ncbi:MAG TPA: DUF3108 domain-containing protein [Paludibacter sp.]|nr:DUF3108 domain-containing protein [Paludibacter sp.]
MIKSLYFLLILWFFPVSVFSQSKKLSARKVFPGETLYYEANWGFLNIGRARTVIDKKIYKIGSNVCYKIEAEGQSEGFGKIFNVHDKWTAYIDTATFVTHKSYRSIREGNKELDEIATFDQIKKKVAVKLYDKKTDAYVLSKVYDTPEHCKDIIAGFLTVRLEELTGYSVGDTITVNGFYEDEIYKISVLYLGKELITIKNTKISCHKLMPVVPKNSLFDGYNSVVVWLSDDIYQSIIRIKAKMFIGYVVMDFKK